MNGNSKGVFPWAQVAAQVMVKQANCVIVSMASERGMEGSEGQSVYAASKNAVNSLTRSWAKELGKKGVRVVGVAPGHSGGDRAAYTQLRNGACLHPRDQH